MGGTGGAYAENYAIRESGSGPAAAGGDSNLRPEPAGLADVRGSGGGVDRGEDSGDEVVDSTVSKHSVSKPKKPAVDSTVSRQNSKVVNIDDQRKKRAVDSTVSKGRKRGAKNSETVPKPKAIAGHEWRRQGTGWTLLRSWYETLPDGSRKRTREYMQHFSATALREAETLRKVNL